MTTNSSTKVNAGNDFREDFLGFMGFIIDGKCQDLNLGLGNISCESPLSGNAFKPLAAVTTFSDAVGGMNENPNNDAGSEEFVKELTNHQTSMLAYIRSLSPGNSGARDLLQEVNITLWQKRESFQIGTNFKAWAFQTIRYHMLNHRRRLVSQGWLVFDDDLIQRMAPGFESEPDELEERHFALRQCLMRLRPQDRELLHHRYATDGSLQEYATKIRRSEGTLKAVLFNLRAALKRCIERELQAASRNSK
jgi:RNA polymerase sigma-70 factor, ECF subfamily